MMPYVFGRDLKRQELGFDAWGLMFVGVSAVLELRVFNPHKRGHFAHAGDPITSLDDYFLIEWTHTHKVYDLGWKASGLLEASGMFLLIVAECFANWAFKGRSTKHVLASAICCCPGPASDSG